MNEGLRKSSRPVSPRMVSPSAFDGHSMDGSSHAIAPQPQSSVVSSLVGPGPSQNRVCAICAHGSHLAWHGILRHLMFIGWVPYSLVLCAATAPPTWPDCSGTLASFGWNHQPESNGISGRIPVEWVAGIVWNSQNRPS